MIAEFKGQNGKIQVYEEYIIISRATFGGFVSQGGHVGERRIYYRDMTSFEFKKPTFIANGYYKVILPGTADVNAKVGILSSSKESMKDQNTIVLRAFSSKVGLEAERIYNLIIDLIRKSKQQDHSKQTATAAPSKMDELKKVADLRDAGILTEEEFQAEKKKLLS
jgi:hypothetical protein